MKGRDREKIPREAQFVKGEFGIFFFSLLPVFGCTLREIFSAIPFKPVCFEQGEDLGLVRDRREGAVREHSPALSTGSTNAITPGFWQP